MKTKPSGIKIGMLVAVYPFFLMNAQTESSNQILIVNRTSALLSATQNAPRAHLARSKNPAKSAGFILLYFYQSLLSGQLSAGCGFSPSCSSFSIRAIQQFGLLRGICLTADRLTRCNGRAQDESENFLFDHYTGKVKDEPSMYRIHSN